MGTSHFLVCFRHWELLELAKSAEAQFVALQVDAARKVLPPQAGKAILERELRFPDVDPESLAHTLRIIAVVSAFQRRHTGCEILAYADYDESFYELASSLAAQWGRWSLGDPDDVVPWSRQFSLYDDSGPTEEEWAAAFKHARARVAHWKAELERLEATEGPKIKGAQASEALRHARWVLSNWKARIVAPVAPRPSHRGDLVHAIESEPLGPAAF